MQPARRILSSALLLACCLLAANAHAESSGPVVTYLERYHRLTRDDIIGRIRLAEFCREHQLHQQECDLLAEASKLRPDDGGLYRDLLKADLRRFRAVDKTWAGKIETLMGPGYRLHHSPHFSVLTNMEEGHAQTLLDTLEASYKQVYTDSAAIGLRPMPPAGRLLTVLFKQYDDYRDYLQRYENADSQWSAGHYSWRTNRCAFFHDADNPAFAEYRGIIRTAEAKAAELRAQLESPNTPTAKRFQLQEQLKRLTTEIKAASHRLATVAQQATLDKTRHEAAHQVLFNSGLQRRGQYYPFWLAEGIATLFETGTTGAGPRGINASYLRQYREAQAANRLCTLAEMFRYHPGSNDANDAVLDHYAQAWALTHFLWNKRPKQFAAYLSAIDTPDARRSLDLHFARCFGDINELESAFKAHMKQLQTPSNLAAVPSN